MKIHIVYFILILIISSAVQILGQQNNEVFNSTKNTWEYNPWSADNIAQRRIDEQLRQQNQQYWQSWQEQNTILMNSLVNFNQQWNLGLLKIRKGLATTSFTPSSQNSFIEKLAQQESTPIAQQASLQTALSALSAFNNFLKIKKLKTNDLADANALSFVLAYQMYKDEPPGDTRMQKMRQWFIKDLINSRMFQGTEDKGRQSQYESLAIRTMYGWRAYQLSKQTNISNTERLEYKKIAEEFASKILKTWWNKDLETLNLANNDIGFADAPNEGEKIIKSGKASTTFVRSNAVLSASQLVKQYNTNETKIKKMLQEFDQYVKSIGGSTNDVAWVNAVAFVFTYEVYTNGKVKLNAQQFNWVLKEMEKDMLGMADFQAMANEEKQKYYENVAIKAMLIYDKYQSSSYKTEIIAAAKQDLNDIFNPRKIDEYTLTSTGFIKKE